MTVPALQDRSGSVRTGEYHGATTLANFGDARAEFCALRSGCGVYDLGWRAKIALTGSDRVRWLNGMVTNNIRDLEAGRGIYAFLLNPQGHILGDLYAYNRGESIVVDTDRGQMEKILATFDHYIIMDDVEVVNVSEKLTALGIAGPKSGEILKSVGFVLRELPLQLLDLVWRGLACTVVRGEDAEHESYEIWIATENKMQFWDALVAVGATPVGSDAFELQRIALGIPSYGQDIRERDLPQETEQSRALNFNKGCYVGQEIVERIRSRGNVHRKFTGFVIDGDATSIAPGAKIAVAGKEVGEVTSIASLPIANGDQTVALGYIRREVSAPGKEVEIAGTPAKIATLPFTDIK